MDIVIVGIDLGKNSCSVAGLDASGRVVLRRRMRRSVLENFVQRSSALHRGDGGVLRRASSGPGIRGSGARGPPDVAGICSPVCEGAEER